MSRSEKLKNLIHSALHEKQADLWALDGVELEKRPLTSNEHPGQAAVLLAREALGQFDLPSQVHLSYKGMRRASGHGQHALRDGVIHINAEFNSLSGHKHYVDIPVVVHGGYMVFPEVFIDSAGSAQVMAQSAFDAMLKRGDVYHKVQDRLNMYSPHVEPSPVEDTVSVGKGMFGVTADHTPHGLDPAERARGEWPRAGEMCTLTDDIQVRIRGGSRIIYDAGTEVKIIRDMAGDGYLYYVEFPDRRRAPVHYDNLS